MDPNDKDEFPQILQQKLESLKLEIKQAKEDIELRSAFVMQKQEQVENILKLLEAEGIHIDRTELHGTLPVSLAEIVARVLLQKGEPLHYKKLAEEVELTGFKIQGQNHYATLIALLHRKQDEFARIGQGTWGLKEWGLTPRRRAKTTPKKRTRRERRMTT